MKSPRIPILVSLPNEAESVEILLASDIHNGAAQFSEKKWKVFEDRLSMPNTYVMFAGDQADDFPLYDIAIALGIEDRYRSEAAFVDIGVGSIKSGTRQVHYVVRVNHKAQNNVNYGTADGFDGIDIFVSGHTHKPMDKPLGKLVYDTSNKKVYEKTVENIVAGHFLDFGGYGERGGYRPTSQKLYSIILSGKKKAIETRGFHL